MADMALQRRLLGQQDSRGPVGMLSRGANVYGGASMAAHSGGGPQFGRPPSAISQEQNVQPNLSFQGAMTPDQLGMPLNMNPKPINLLGAMQRRLTGGQGGL